MWIVPVANSTSGLSPVTTLVAETVMSVAAITQYAPVSPPVYVWHDAVGASTGAGLVSTLPSVSGAAGLVVRQTRAGRRVPPQSGSPMVVSTLLSTDPELSSPPRKNRQPVE